MDGDSKMFVVTFFVGGPYTAMHGHLRTDDDTGRNGNQSIGFTNKICW